jgi:PhnB protein
MKLNAHIALAFDGQCEAAFRLYERCFEGTITFMLTWGNSPMSADAPAGWDAKIFHATLKVGDSVITGSDQPPGRYDRPKGFSIILQMDDPDLAERVFQTLAESSRLEMPLQETFWAYRFAVLTDRFGIPWTINCGDGGAPPLT